MDLGLGLGLGAIAAAAETALSRKVATSPAVSACGALDTARAFCKAFYLGLVAGRTVRQAFDIGCAAASQAQARIDRRLYSCFRASISEEVAVLRAEQLQRASARRLVVAVGQPRVEQRRQAVLRSHLQPSRAACARVSGGRASLGAAAA